MWTTLSQLLTYCVLEPTQPPTLSGTGNEYCGLHGEDWLGGAMRGARGLDASPIVPKSLPFVVVIGSSGGSNRKCRHAEIQSQRHRDFTDRVLWIRRLLVIKWDLVLSRVCRHVHWSQQLVWLLQRRPGVHQQLYQSFHLRRQVRWVPDRRQTHGGSSHRQDTKCRECSGGFKHRRHLRLNVLWSFHSQDPTPNL